MPVVQAGLTAKACPVEGGFVAGLDIADGCKGEADIRLVVCLALRLFIN